MGEIRRKTPSPEEKSECSALFEIYKNKKKVGYLLESGKKLTQENLAELFPSKVDHNGEIVKGITSGAVGHYLRGKNALNLNCALIFAHALDVQVSDFSERLSGLVGVSFDRDTLIEELVELSLRLPRVEIEELVEIAKLKLRKTK